MTRLRLDDAEIVRLYRAGATARAIADSLRVAPNTVLRRLWRAGVSRHTVGRPRSISADDVVAGYLAGYSVAQLACRHATSRDTITRRLGDAGVEIRAAQRQQTQQVTLIADLWELYRDAGRPIAIARMARWGRCGRRTLQRAIAARAWRAHG